MDMVGYFINISRVSGQRGFIGHGLSGAERRASELNDAFRHRIDMVVELGPEPVEHFMHGDELNALEIPMCLFGKQRQVYTVRETCIENVDRDRLRVRLQIILCFM